MTAQTAPTTQPTLAAFQSQGLRPSFENTTDSVQACVTIAGERYYGYSVVDNETALLDLLSELPDHDNLRVSRALKA